MDIRQREVISKQKRKPVIFILYVKGSADISWILVDKAEDALICARHRFDRLELQSEGFPFAPNESNLSILRTNRRAAADHAGLKLKVDDNEQRLPIQLV